MIIIIIIAITIIIIVIIIVIMIMIIAVVVIKKTLSAHDELGMCKASLVSPKQPSSSQLCK